MKCPIHKYWTLNPQGGCSLCNQKEWQKEIDKEIYKLRKDRGEIE